METPFFDTIVTIANERPVMAADFAQFVGRENWLSFERAEPLGADCESFCSGIVYKFTLIDANTVENMCGVKIEDVGVMWMDADELAIRIEES